MTSWLSSPDVAEKPADVVLLTGSLVQAVDTYWNALTHFQNTLEDIAGADERLEYLLALRLRLVVALHQIASATAGSWSDVASEHQAAHMLEAGAPGLQLDGPAVVRGVGLDRSPWTAAALQAQLLAFGQSVLARLPGDIPEAQGTSGQRQIIRAMRDWSSAAEARGEDLSFLAARLEDL